MAKRQRGREYKHAGKEKDEGNSTDDIGDALLKLDTTNNDPDQNEKTKEEARAVSREAMSSAEEFKQQAEKIKQQVEQKMRNDLKIQHADLDRLSQEMLSVGTSAENMPADADVNELSQRVAEWKAKMKDISERFNTVKNELTAALAEEAKEKAEFEISQADLQSVHDYYTQELLADSPDRVNTLDAKIVASIIKGEDAGYTEDQKAEAVKSVLKKIEQHMIVAETLKDKSSADSAKWGARYDKLKQMEHLLNKGDVKVKVAAEKNKVEVPAEAPKKKDAFPSLENKAILQESDVTLGQILRVKRSSGEMEDGWQVIEINNGKAVLRKFLSSEVGPRKSPKVKYQFKGDISLKELVEWNAAEINVKPATEKSKRSEEEKNKAEYEDYLELLNRHSLEVKKIIEECDAKISSVKDQYPNFYNEFLNDIIDMHKLAESEKKKLMDQLSVAIPNKNKTEIKEEQDKMLAESMKKFTDKRHEINTAYEWLTTDPGSTRWSNKSETKSAGSSEEKAEKEKMKQLVREKLGEVYELIVGQPLIAVSFLEKFNESQLDGFVGVGADVKNIPELARDYQEIERSAWANQVHEELKLVEGSLRHNDMKGAKTWHKKVKIDLENFKKIDAQTAGNFEGRFFAADQTIKSLEAVPQKIEPAQPENLPEAAPDEALPPQPEAEQPEAKKSLWQRTKEKLSLIANRDVGKVAADAAYKTVTSVFGIKTATDIIGAVAGKVKSEYGFGDIHKRLVSSREIKEEKALMKEYLKDVYEGGEKLEERIAALRANIEQSKHIDPKERDSMLKNLQNIATEYKSAAQGAEKERDKKIEAVMNLYMKNKVSGMTLAKDALNTALTATGMSMIRGAVYATMSIGERLMKSNREFELKKAEGAKNEAKALHMIKDLMVNAAVETGRSLVFMGAKKETKGAGRVIDFVKAVGTMARGFGIYGLAITDSMSPAEAIEAFIGKVEEQGIACAIKDDFLINAEKTIQLYAHPVDTIAGRFGGADNADVPGGVIRENNLASMSVIRDMSPESAVLEKYHLESLAMDPEQMRETITKFGQFEQAGVSVAALQQMAEGGVSPESMTVMENFLAMSQGRPGMMGELSYALASGHSPEEIYDSMVVHKGDGLERVLQRQLKLNPAAFGYEGDVNDAQAVQKWAGHEASVIAQKQGIADKYFVFDQNKPQFLVIRPDNTVEVSGQLYQEVPRPAVEAPQEAAIEDGNKVHAAKELIDFKTNTPIYMTDEERATYDQMVNKGDYDDAMAYKLQARNRGQVFEIEGGEQIHRADADWIGDKPAIKVISGTSVVPVELSGYPGAYFVPTEANEQAEMDWDKKYGSRVLSAKEGSPAEEELRAEYRAHEMVRQQQHVTDLKEALSQTAPGSFEHTAITNTLKETLREFEMRTDVKPETVFGEDFVRSIENTPMTKTVNIPEAKAPAPEKSYEEIVEKAKAEQAAQPAETSSAEQPKKVSYEEIVEKAKAEQARSESAGGGRSTADVEADAKDMFEEQNRMNVAFNKFSDKSANFDQRMSALRGNLEPGVRTSMNNIEYIYDGNKVRYKVGNIVGVLDSERKANALADIATLTKNNSQGIATGDKTAVAEFKQALDNLAKVSTPKSAA